MVYEKNAGGILHNVGILKCLGGFVPYVICRRQLLAELAIMLRPD